ncbi:histidine decarboxylase [Nocardia stercoris]|uniref:Histidine decarboxylase n=1 Tax=Nocardia stercoris TaxID=2483361 RepID=A0A3M2KR77_9NOCA|nr:histidine decarboxylase [Nocardia stercoris]RMI27969.1 histidine decarboxylase [Nocardia stercoris]
MRTAPFDQYRIHPAPQPVGDPLGRIDDFIAEMRAERPYVLGFPGNLDFSFSNLAGLLDILVNNVGDPDSGEKSDISAKPMERAVVDFMAELANADPRDVYGYVASGGSEADQFGLDRGCTLLPEARIYCSAGAHYCIRKSARLMRKELVVVGCDDRGRIDTDALARECRDHPGRGAVVVATVGTTMTGAIDDVDAITAAAAPAGRVYVHVDAALGGLIVPFTPERESWGFARPEVGSVAISMHKGLGMPVPCALAMCRAELVDSRVEGEYVGATDSTLACSRSGLASTLLWYALATKGRTGLANNARRALDMAEYTAKKLADAGMHPILHPSSIIVVFDRPAEWICRKYHLATEGTRAHIVTVPHVTAQVIDELHRDVLRSLR